jgi:type I restriction enzyme S subunit
LVVAQIEASGHGAIMAGFNSSLLKELRIPLPPLAEQRRIADVLDRADALRAKRLAALAQLDALAKSIFLDMFGDPDKNPKRWPLCPVADYVVALQGGKSVDPESGVNPLARFRVLKISAVTGMRFLPGESKPVPASYEPPVSHFVRRGDLLFSRANTSDLVGAVAFVEDVPDNLLLPDKLWRFVWRQPPSVEPRFVWALFQTQAVREEISRRATGTSGSMKNISQEKVLAIETILPPLRLQREFVRRAGAVDHLRAVSAASLAELNALFASLQQRAFAGEL